jgi:hypothetical protein
VLPLPAANQLSVATRVGTDLVAAWVSRHGRMLEGQVRLLDNEDQPASTPFQIVGASSVGISCGLGCRTFTMAHAPPVLHVILNPDRDSQTALLPTRWKARDSPIARQILNHAQATMNTLSSVQDVERVSSVSGLYALSHYRMQAPDRLAVQTYVIHGRGRPRLESEEIKIGASSWIRELGSPWQLQPPQGTLPFTTMSFFLWSPFAQATRLISIDHRHGGHPQATILLMDPGTPAWETLTVELATGRVLSTAMITPGYTEIDRINRFNDAGAVAAPVRRRR